MPHAKGMIARTGIDFDELMRHLMVVGFAALAAWTAVPRPASRSGW